MPRAILPAAGMPLVPIISFDTICHIALRCFYMDFFRYVLCAYLAQYVPKRVGWKLGVKIEEWLNIMRKMSYLILKAIIIAYQRII